MFFVAVKGANIVHTISEGMAFVGDENAANFRAKKLTEDTSTYDTFEAITIKDFEEKFGGEVNEDKSE